MSKQTMYVVFRHGSNAANQSMCPKAAIGVYPATSREEACRDASQEHTVYNNQRLTAEPVSRCSQADVNAAADRDCRI